MIPNPPNCAKTRATRLSVTVSMAADNTGICNRMSLAKKDSVETSLGIISEYLGTNKISSKVRASSKTIEPEFVKFNSETLVV